MRTTFSVPAPFDLAATIDSHGWLYSHPFHPRASGARPELDRIERIRGTPRHIRIRQTTPRARPARDDPVRLVAETDAPPRDRAAVRAAIDKMLGLHEDLSGFYALAQTDPRLRPVVARGAGRTCRGTTLWEDVVKGIIQTNIQWRQALKCMATTCTLGTRHRASGLHAWPTPQQVLDAGPDWLRDQARVGYRADALIQLAHELDTGSRDLDALDARAPHMDTASLVAELQTIRGIGPATAHAIAGFLGKHDVISVDSATVAYVKHHYTGHYGGDAPNPREAGAVFDRYGEWKGKAWWYEAWLARDVRAGPIDPRTD